jgi:hypothetical protein
MSALVSTLFRTVILDDAAYREWRERPNPFLRGLILVVVVSLLAGLVSFAITFVAKVSPFNPTDLEDRIRQSMDWQYQLNPSLQDPEVEQMINETVDFIVPMVTDIANIQTPLPRGITGFFQALGGWLSRALSGSVWSVSFWLFYGALVLIVVNLLGGSAKLPDFLGMTSLYVMPSLLVLLGQIPCVGCVFSLAGLIWSLVISIKAVSVASDLDVGQSILAVFAPAIVIALLILLATIAVAIWATILF